jgi:hypothetical protein
VGSPQSPAQGQELPMTGTDTEALLEQMGAGFQTEVLSMPLVAGAHSQAFGILECQP